MTPVPFDRSRMIDALRAGGHGGEPFDVVVIGGGITGVGVALDAAVRGLRTALVERGDFAAGTSSKSSKMIHGGLRYLQNGDVRLVYQALRERTRLMRNAPHLVEVLPFMVPIMSKDGVVSRRVARTMTPALWMYDLTGGWRIGKLHRRISAERAAAHFPTLPADRVAGGFVFYDAGADDARLTLTIARTAAAHGAILVNRCEVVDITAADGRASGVVVEAGGERFHVPARAIVNATGVWADQVRAMDEGADPHSIRPAKGVHIVVPWEKVRNDISVIIPVRHDKRSLFLVPWGELPDGTFRHTYIGTTDTDYDGSLDDPQVDGDDLEYVLQAVNQALTTEIGRADITGVWSGLRPLVRSPDSTALPAKTADLSRRHIVEVSESGVVRVGGGKLTTYREMAEDTVDEVLAVLAQRPDGRPGRRWGRRRHPTRRLALFGAERGRDPARGSLDAHLRRRYGSEAAEIKALVALSGRLGEPLVEGQPYLRAEAVFAARAEMATTLEDVLVRRTRAHLFDRAASLRAAPAVADLLAEELGWTAAETARQLDDYRRLCAAEEDAGDHLTHAAD